MLSAPKCGRHGNIVCSECIVADDVAKRCWEQVKNVAHSYGWDERIRGYLAIKLQDGSTDGVLYETKQDAVKHCRGDEQWFAFFSFRTAPNGFASPKDAAVFLAYHRMVYDQGGRLPDPDDARGGPDMIMPMNDEHLMDQLGRLMRSAVN